MLSEDKKSDSIIAVQEFSDNEEGEFFVDVEVYENGIKKYYYSDITFIQSYDARYGQHTVNIVWEDDTTQSASYAERGLRGCYNTNFNEMRYTNQMLVIENNNITLYIMIDCQVKCNKIKEKIYELPRQVRDNPSAFWVYC